MTSSCGSECRADDQSNEVRTHGERREHGDSERENRGDVRHEHPVPGVETGCPEMKPRREARTQDGTEVPAHVDHCWHHYRQQGELGEHLLGRLERESGPQDDHREHHQQGEHVADDCPPPPGAERLLHRGCHRTTPTSQTENSRKSIPKISPSVVTIGPTRLSGS